MLEGGTSAQAKGPIKQFAADDVQSAKRFTTPHNEKGQGVLHPDNHGDHHKIILDGLAAANTIHNTKSELVNLNNDKDLKRAWKCKVRYNWGQHNCMDVLSLVA